MSDPSASGAMGRTFESASEVGQLKAPFDQSPEVEPADPYLDPAGKKEKPRSLRRDAFEELRGNPIFWISVALMALFVTMAIFPGLFTAKDPTLTNLELSREPPQSGAWFGYDVQGRDVYARAVYGARASIMVGIATTSFSLILGVFAGVLAGFYGGKIDTFISRVVDIFFAIPLLLGGILFLTSFPPGQSQTQQVLVVSTSIAVLGWTLMARIMRSTVIQTKQSDYVQAARALGAKPNRIIRKHVMPNAVGPVIVVATISLGGFIGAEAILSFLGIGLQPPAISWGIQIADAQQYFRAAPHMLLFPAAFLSLTVLAFIMFGDAVRDAFDPKLR
jgi:oligopeptide transport system permease protein